MKKMYLEPVSSSVQFLAVTGILSVSGPFAGTNDNTGTGDELIKAETGR